MEVHPVRPYRHLFFDLDHTLWDFEANSRAVLTDLCTEYLANDKGIGPAEFIPVYEEVNAALWEQHEAGMMPKDMLRALRFARTLRHFGVEDGRLARTLEDQYLERCPKRGVLMPGALRLLEDLYPHYHLHIITNGFTEVQMQKLDTTGIRRFFKVVLTSEMAGVAKPAAGIFRHALRAAGAQVRASLMIGDNARSDMAGARDAGLDQAHLSPQGTADPEATYRVEALDQLRPLLLADHLPSGTNT